MIICGKLGFGLELEIQLDTLIIEFKCNCDYDYYITLYYIKIVLSDNINQIIMIQHVIAITLLKDDLVLIITVLLNVELVIMVIVLLNVMINHASI